MNSRLIIYKASAGSGKTFTLAANYISYLLANPEAYRHLLAMTFTNKATGEMKERILSQLYGISHGLPESDGYLRKAEELLREAGFTEDIRHRPLTEQTLRENARRALTSVLHNYSFFRIETIDSFMLGILRGLARELELGRGMEIELDTKKVVSDAVKELVAGLKYDSKELSWLMEYINSAIDDERHWDVTRELKGFGGNLYKEAYLRHADELEELLREHPDTISRLRRRMKEQVEAAQRDTVEAANGFFALTERMGLTDDDFNEKRNGPYPFFEKLRDGSSPNITPTIIGFVEGSKRWSAVKTPNRALVESEAPAFSSLLKDTVTLYARQLTLEKTRKVVANNFYQLQLLGSIGAQIRSTSRDENRFLLADTCLMLMKMASDPADTSFIYEKTGTTIDHILIDEFQDTSGLQWANFLPLLKENAARGMQDLIVGDVKQAIYRFRDSNADIMGSQVECDMQTANPRTVVLDTNRRSRKNIISFNNRFFRKLVDRLGTITDVCDTADIVSFYADLEQQADAAKQGGSVTVVTLPDDESGKEHMCQQTAEQVVRLLDAGLSQRDIAILTRENDDIALLADWFAAHPEALATHDVRLVSGEAFQFKSSEAVALLIGAIRWVSHNDDNVSLAKIGIDYHRLVLKDGLTLPRILALRDSGYGLPEALVAHHDELASLPLSALAYRLYDVLGIRLMEGQDAWMQGFFDILRQYAAGTDATLSDFLKDWDERLYKKTIPSSQADGIVCMTIHKAKGLEFHSVIIPFANWPFEKNGSSTLWIGTEGTDFSEIPCLPVTRCTDMSDSLFAPQYKEETKHIWMDNLNLLYVAFTRPTSNLIVLKEAGAAAGPPKKAGILIDYGMEGIDDALETEEGVTCFPDDTVCTEHFEQARQTNRLLPDVSTQPCTFHAAPLRMTFRQSNRSKTFINRGDDSPISEFIEQGNLLHEVFAHIRSAADAPEAIQALYRQGVVDAAQRDEISRIVDEALRQPEAADWFSGRYELFNECTILTLVDGEMKQQRPDRVMRTEGRTIVVDFKTGDPRKEHHRQVGAYMSLLRQMGFEGVEGYLWYVKQQNIVRV
ncbi:MAG: UvrD-helicase domain-containing protein [Bacteroidaceae bacterium]|nr:UvrD-helicase domain-containing protein [Bacteroidaceae bacterium]